MQTAIERLIQNIPQDAEILDIGYGGLDGENTTNYLRERFRSVEGICKDQNGVDRYRAMYPESSNDKVTVGFYPNDMPTDRKWDLLVHDTNIEGNLAFWSPEGQEKAWSYVKDGGGILTYMMLTDFYGDDVAQAAIKEHRMRYWQNCLPHIVWTHVLGMEREERRPYIMWVLLKKRIFDQQPTTV